MSGHRPWSEIRHKRDDRAVDELFETLRDEWPRTFDRIAVRTKRIFDDVPRLEGSVIDGTSLSKLLHGVPVFEDPSLPVGHIELRSGSDVVRVLGVE